MAYDNIRELPAGYFADYSVKQNYWKKVEEAREDAEYMDRLWFRALRKLGYYLDSDDDRLYDTETESLVDLSMDEEWKLYEKANVLAQEMLEEERREAENVW